MKLFIPSHFFIRPRNDYTAACSVKLINVISTRLTSLQLT